MRKIERQMCDAVQGNRNWKNANTEVTIDLETKVSSVYLHGNLIATVSGKDITRFKIFSLEDIFSVDTSDEFANIPDEIFLENTFTSAAESIT